MQSIRSTLPNLGYRSRRYRRGPIFTVSHLDVGDIFL